MSILSMSFGVVCASLGVYLVVRGRSIMSSEPVRRGYGITTWLTGQGMEGEPGGSPMTTAAPRFDGQDKDGRPEMRETLSISNL